MLLPSHTHGGSSLITFSCRGPLGVKSSSCHMEPSNGLQVKDDNAYIEAGVGFFCKTKLRNRRSRLLAILSDPQVQSCFPTLSLQFLTVQKGRLNLCSPTHIPANRNTEYTRRGHPSAGKKAEESASGFLNRFFF